MLEQLFGIRYIVVVDGQVYGYTLQGGTATTVKVTPTVDVLFGVYSVPTFGHKVAVADAISNQIHNERVNA